MPIYANVIARPVVLLVTGLLLVAFSAESSDSKSSPPVARANSLQEDTLRVFFLGRSNFSGIPAPFEEICGLADVPCSAHRHWDFIEHVPRNAMPIGPSAMARNRNVLRILATERFDAVFMGVFAYNTEFFEPDPAYETDVIEGAEYLYRLVVVSGAQPYLDQGYATMDNPGDTTRIAQGFGRVAARLNSVALEAGTPPVVLVPGGPFFGAMATAVGPDRWFADPLHASVLGQYAMARLYFSCVTGRDPTTFPHPPRISTEDAAVIDAGILRFRETCTSRLAPG